jgi:hypothetical protein
VTPAEKEILLWMLPYCSYSSLTNEEIAYKTGFESGDVKHSAPGFIPSIVDSILIGTNKELAKIGRNVDDAIMVIHHEPVQEWNAHEVYSRQGSSASQNSCFTYLLHRQKAIIGFADHQ